MPPSTSAAATRARRGKVCRKYVGDGFSKTTTTNENDDGKRRTPGLARCPLSLSSLLSSVLIVARSRRLFLQDARDGALFSYLLRRTGCDSRAGRDSGMRRKFCLSFFSYSSPSSFPPSSVGHGIAFFSPRLRLTSLARIELARQAPTPSRLRSSLLCARTRSKRVVCKLSAKRERSRASRGRERVFFLSSSSSTSSPFPLFPPPLLSLSSGPRCHLRGHPGLVILR